MRQHSLPREHHRKIKCAICSQKVRIIKVNETRSRFAVHGQRKTSPGPGELAWSCSFCTRRFTMDAHQISERRDELSRFALRFDEAVRVENRIKALQKRAAQDWRSDPVVDLSGLPDQAPSQPTQAAHDLGFMPDQQGKPAATPEKHISTHPKAVEPNVFDQFDSSNGSSNPTGAASSFAISPINSSGC